MARGEPIWQTSSTGPTSIPSSSEAVATRARSSPARSRASTSRRRAGRQAAVVGRHHAGLASRIVLGQSLPQLVRHPLGHLAGVDEDQGRPVRRRTWSAMRSSTSANWPCGATASSSASGSSMATSRSRRCPQSTHGRGRSVGVDAAQQAGHHLEGPLGGRQPDALEPAARRRDHAGQPLEAQRQVRSPLVPGQRVHLVDDDRAHPGAAWPATTAAVSRR